jgi:hypothetical protein
MRVLRNNLLVDDLCCRVFVNVVPGGQHCLDERVSAVSEHVQLALLRLAERRNAAVPEEQDQLGGAGGVADLDSHVAGDPEASLQVRVCLLEGLCALSFVVFPLVPRERVRRNEGAGVNRGPGRTLLPAPEVFTPLRFALAPLAGCGCKGVSGRKQAHEEPRDGRLPPSGSWGWRLDQPSGCLRPTAATALFTPCAWPQSGHLARLRNPA